MAAPDPEQLIHQLAVGDAGRDRRDRRVASRTSDDPMILVAAALFAPDGDDARRRAAATVGDTTRDRQLVAIAGAHLRGDRDLVDALARDHLVDHPDSVLVAWIAGGRAIAVPPDHRSDPRPRRRHEPQAHRNPADPRRRPGQRRVHRARHRSSTTPTCSTSRRARCSPTSATHQSAVSAWFVVLAFAAALLAPDRDRRRHALDRNGRCGSRCRSGIAAAVVQVVGLLRWPILVPGYASDAASSEPSVASSARDSFTTASDILGTAIGETLGYLLTATWTVLVVVALGRRYAGRWFQVLGIVVRGRSCSSACSRRSTCPASTPRTSSGTCCGACG